MDVDGSASAGASDHCPGVLKAIVEIDPSTAEVRVL
jgi:hypothetical protein